MRTDLHVHSHFSFDSQTEMQAACRQAVQAGLTHIGFTDHYDLDPSCEEGIYDPEAFFEEIKAVQDKFAGRLAILAGIEFSEPHLYPKEYEKIRTLPYDYIIGAIHYIDGMDPYFTEKMTYPLPKMYERYWEEMERMVETGGFQIIAHLDYPKRYFNACLAEDQTMLRIFQKACDRGLALEINTSPFRKGETEPMPVERMLELYTKAGGYHITLGSDAHEPEQAGSGIERGRDIAKKLGLQPCIFEKRKLITQPWG